MSLSKTITVVGGNGFLGKRICQAAIYKGHNVISLSRSGSPPLAVSYQDHKWMEQVKWHKLDVFDPASYRDQLAQSDVVIHSMGILLESNYKSKLSKTTVGGASEFSREVCELVSPNPMAKSINTSYDHMNRASALITANAFIKANEESSGKFSKSSQFVYISLDKGFAVIPRGYIQSKRTAESQLIRLSEEHGNLRPLIVRPGFMYDAEVHGDLRSGFNIGLQLLNRVNQLAGGVLGGLIRPSISTQKVATRIIETIDTNDGRKFLMLEDLLR